MYIRSGPHLTRMGVLVGLTILTVAVSLQ
uniref:Uncharacterized protein n=1 Tax=Anguilla anguilla TaxID=7936 RepID=A0A0E9RL18_ANGAN